MNGTGADLLARRILTHTSVLPNEYFEFEPSRRLKFCFDKKKNGTPDIHLCDTGADLLARRILTHTSVLPNEYFEFEL